MHCKSLNEYARMNFASTSQQTLIEYPSLTLFLFSFFCSCQIEYFNVALTPLNLARLSALLTILARYRFKFTLDFDVINIYSVWLSRTLFVNGKCQIFQNICLRCDCGVVSVVGQSGHRLIHPQQCVVIVFVQVRLATHFEAIVRCHLCAVLYAVQFTACNAGRFQFVCILQAHQGHRCTIQILLRWKLQYCTMVRDILQEFCSIRPMAHYGSESNNKKQY